MDPNLNKLIEGYRAFQNQATYKQTLQTLAKEGQHPNIMIISCCDARVEPAHVFDCEPGDLFCLRNVANIVPPYAKAGSHHATSAALEYAICHLNVAHLIIMGHSHCGGLKALMADERLEQDEFISDWMRMNELDVTQFSDVDELAKVAVLNSVKHCHQFPWIKERLEQGSLMIHPWFFDLEQAQVLVLDPATGSSKPL